MFAAAYLTLALQQALVRPLASLPQSKPTESFDKGLLRYSTNSSYIGKVISIHSGTITVENCDAKRYDDKARNFELVDFLVRGETNPDVGDGDSYRLKDIEIGDQICVSCICHNKTNVYYAIKFTIYRKKGGPVPPSSNPAENSTPHHVMMNIINDLKDGVKVEESLLRRNGFREEANKLYPNPDPKSQPMKK